MRHFVHFVVLLFVSAMLCTTSCTSKSSESNDTNSDTLRTDTSSSNTKVAEAEEIPIPKSADELFDDFIFNFADNEALQLRRIQFPLPVTIGNETTEATRSSWQFESFFMSQGFYTLIASNYAELDKSKDTKIEHVVVEHLLSSADNVCQYNFNRVKGYWTLQSVSQTPLTEHPSGEFYAFCNSFLNDSTFRSGHMAESIEFSGPDPDDDFQRLEGFIMPEQVMMFSPELPKGEIYNIIYGEGNEHGNERLLVIRGIANGFEIELTFRKTNDQYMLVKLVV